MTIDEQLQSENVASHDEQIAESSPAPEAETNSLESDSAAETHEEKKPNRVQERINQLTREKYEERQRVEELERRLKELETKAPEPTKAEPKAAPKEDDYSSYDEYQKAREDYLVERAQQAAYEKIQAEQTATQKVTAEQLRQEEIQAKRAEFQKNLEGKREMFVDFEEVAYGHQFMDKGLAEMIFDMEKGPEVAYHLGSHLDEAERIFAMSEIQRVRELTKLELQMQELQPKRVSTAPDPIKPITGSSETVSDKDPDNMSVEEWTAWRRKNLEAKR